jgi:hypothetical protein
VSARLAPAQLLHIPSKRAPVLFIGSRTYAQIPSLHLEGQVEDSFRKTGQDRNGEDPNTPLETVTNAFP